MMSHQRGIVMKFLYVFLTAALFAYSPLSLADTPASFQTQTSTSSPKEIKSKLNQYYFDAARQGNTEMLQEFIQAGYNLNIQDEKGYTALILAAYHGHPEAVNQLLKAGANACVQDKTGNTALMGAIFKGELRIARTLMKAGCSPDQTNGSGQTASMYAALFQRKEILDALVKQGANTELKDKRGNSVDNLSQGNFN